MAKICLQGRVGEIHPTKNYGKLVIDRIIDSKNVFITFLETGYTTKCSYSRILEGRVKDKLCPSVCGWGINDLRTSTYSSGGSSKRCPAYIDWKLMIRRCFDVKYREYNVSYNGCSICDEWRYFSNFRKWVMEEQPNKDWEKLELDKDLLLQGNKLYSPESCSYITSTLNCFILDSKRSRGNYMIGVSYYKNGRCFRADCNDPFNISTNFIGYFETELEAHKAWQAKKHEYASLLAEEQQDHRVAKVLRERYAPDKDWTNS